MKRSFLLTHKCHNVRSSHENYLAISASNFFLQVKVECLHDSGQIIATSHDRFPPNGGLVTEIPGYFRETFRLVKYCNLASSMTVGTLPLQRCEGCRP